MRIHNIYLGLLFFMLLFLITVTLKIHENNQPFSREIIVRTDKNFHTENDVKIFVAGLVKNGISTDLCQF